MKTEPYWNVRRALQAARVPHEAMVRRNDEEWMSLESDYTTVLDIPEEWDRPRCLRGIYMQEIILLFTVHDDFACTYNLERGTCT